MKKIAVKFLIVASLSIGSTALLAQGPPPPPPGDHGGTGNTTGGNAPIGGGLFILMGLGAAYGGKKLYDLRQESLEE